MRRIPEAFRAVVRSDRHLSLHANGSISIKEKDATATLTELSLETVGCEHVFAFTLDHREKKNAVPLSDHTSKSISSRWNKVCDGIIIWWDKTAAQPTWRILVCDLKSNTPTGSDWKEQLWSSACFVEYLIAIIRRFHPEVPPVSPLYFHAVAFHLLPGLSGKNKRPTKLTHGSGFPKSPLGSPARIPVANRQHIYLRALCV